MGWRPSVSFNPPSVPAVTEWAQERIRVTQDALQELGDGVIEDLGLTYDALSDCLAGLDSVRVDIANRHKEYGQRVLRETFGPLLEWLFTLAIPERNPNPKLWVLRNPHALHSGGEPDEVRINSQADIANAVGHHIPHPVLFIHGMGADGSFEDAFDYWKSFANELGLYENANEDYKNQLPFVVGWDSSIHNRDIQNLIIVLATVGIPAGMTAGAVLLTANYLELERRAREVAEFLTVYSPINSDPFKQFVVTHSMGSYVYAANTNNHQPHHSTLWWNFEGALSHDAFMGDGEFSQTGEYFANNRLPKTTVYHSETDIALAGPYHVAKQISAMGQVGASSSTGRNFDNVNVTSSARESHGPNELIPGSSGYFRRIGHVIRSRRPTPW